MDWWVTNPCTKETELGLLLMCKNQQQQYLGSTEGVNRKNPLQERLQE